jgi:adenosylcobinamide kinase/adenosylcobinamide-phosphate guanylyltransferase
MALTLLLGGARSGKSALAVRMATRWRGPVTVIVTGEARDEEMAERIRRHRAARPPSWDTIEEPVDLDGAISGTAAEACAVVDCLTLWVSNLLERGEEDAEVTDRAHTAADLASRRSAPTIVVSNEVGSGIVPMNALARRYRDLLGEVNAIWADVAASNLLVVAGRVLPLSEPADPGTDG